MVIKVTFVCMQNVSIELPNYAFGRTRIGFDMTVKVDVISFLD